MKFFSEWSTEKRITALCSVLVLWAGLIVGRLVQLQVLKHADYLKKAKLQQEHANKVLAPRGTIFDRFGNPMAVSTAASSVVVDPKHVENPQYAAGFLASLLHLDRDVLLEKILLAQQKGRRELVVKRRATAAECDNLVKSHLSYIAIRPDTLRIYPNGETAAHVLGAVYRLNGPEVGAAGVESRLEDVLKGQDGLEDVLADVGHHDIDSQLRKKAQPGTPITLTIDERLQFVAERELKAGVEAKHAERGSVVVMDPYTGDIYAMANYPTYDPNKPAVDPKDHSRINLGAMAPFEPGSVFKVITLAAALETTKIRPETPIATGGGTLKLPGRVIHESHHGYGTITMQQVLEKSSNIGAILIGQKVGRQNLYDYLRRFGIGERTGLQLREERGLLRPVEKWQTTTLESISMGHEVAVTSAQLARACAVVANGGSLIKPRLVLKRGNKTEPVEPGRRVIKPETAMAMRMMMEGVVLRGTARNHVKLPGYTAAGKTGTAVIYDVAKHAYTHSYNASFMGFTPVTNPRLVIVVTLNGTHGDGGMGAAAAAPVFQNIAIEALRMYDVPKDIPEDYRAKPAPKGEIFADVVTPGTKSSVMEEAGTLEKLLAKEPLPVDTDYIPAAGEAPKPAIAAPVLLAKALPAPPQPDAEPAPAGPVVPDFRGKSMREVVAEATATGLELQVQGSGVARAQIPGPGAPRRSGERIRVVFGK